MQKFTQKQLRQFTLNNVAVNITNYSFEEVKYLRANHNLKKIGYSLGVYGLNGGLLKDTKTGTLYVITKRTGALFQLF